MAALEDANRAGALANDLILAGRYREAALVLEPAIRKHPEIFFDFLKTRLAECRLRQGSHQEALDLLLKTNLRSDGGEKFARVAYLKALAGDLRTSQEMWEEMKQQHYLLAPDSWDLRNWPGTADSRSLQAAWLVFMGVMADAVDELGASFFLDAAGRIVPQNPILQHRLGLIALRHKQYAKAARHFELGARFGYGILKETSATEASRTASIARAEEAIRQKGGG